MSENPEDFSIVGEQPVDSKLKKLHESQTGWKKPLRVFWWLLLLPVAVLAWSRARLNGIARLVGYAAAAFLGLIYLSAPFANASPATEPASSTKPEISTTTTTIPMTSTTMPTTTSTSTPISESTTAVTATPQGADSGASTALSTTLPPTTQKKVATTTPLTTIETTTTQASLIYYANCTAAKNAGAAPLYRGDPGYRAGLDRDNDGIACET